MNKFHIGDEVDILTGSHSGSQGYVEKVIEDIPGDVEYRVKVGSGDIITVRDFMVKEGFLFEMANIHPKDTGLETSLHAMYNGAAEGLPHGPRVKVSTKGHGRVPIQLKPDVKLAVEKNLKKEDKDIVNAAISYISSNLTLFQDHWDGNITDKELLNSLPKA